MRITKKKFILIRLFLKNRIEIRKKGTAMCLFCMQKIKYQAVDACAIDDIIAIMKEK